MKIEIINKFHNKKEVGEARGSKSQIMKIIQGNQNQLITNINNVTMMKLANIINKILKLQIYCLSYSTRGLSSISSYHEIFYPKQFYQIHG